MGIFNRVRSDLNQINNSEWIYLNSLVQLAELKKNSFDRPVLLFKHSSSCGLSAGAKYKLEEGWTEISAEIDLYFLDLLKYRSISNQVASEFDVSHHSPQIILITNAKAVYHSSHHRINISDIRDNLSKLEAGLKQSD